MKLYHCKKCGTFIGSYSCDELCPTCRRKETYLTKEEVAAILVELQLEIKEKFENEFRISLVEPDDINEIIQQKINALGSKTDVSNEK